MKNDWSNEKKAIELIEKVFLPYLRNKKEELGLCLTKRWFLIADLFKQQLTDKVKNLIEKHHGKIMPVPNNMANFLQPLDLAINQLCKLYLRGEAQIYYNG